MQVLYYFCYEYYLDKTCIQTETFDHTSVLQNQGKSICGLPIFLPFPPEDWPTGKPPSAEISLLCSSSSLNKLHFTHLLGVLRRFSSLIQELYFVQKDNAIKIWLLLLLLFQCITISSWMEEHKILNMQYKTCVHRVVWLLVFKKKPVQMQIRQYLCYEQILFTYNVCFGYLNVFFQPSTHFCDMFLLGEKKLSFYFWTEFMQRCLEGFFNICFRFFLWSYCL